MGQFADQYLLLDWEPDLGQLGFGASSRNDQDDG